MSVLDAINNNLEKEKQIEEEKNKLITYNKMEDCEKIFKLFMDSFFHDIIKYGKLKSLKGYIFLDLKEHSASEKNLELEYMLNNGYSESSIDKPYLDNRSHYVNNSKLGIIFPVNYILFSKKNELLEAFFHMLLLIMIVKLIIVLDMAANVY